MITQLSNGNILLEDKSNSTPFITKLKTLEKTTIVLNKTKK